MLRPPDERVNWLHSIPFFVVHLLPFLAIFTGVTWRAVILGVVLYFGRMFFITAGYHRYFSHRAYKTSRVFQFILAFGGSMAAQKGALWWASHHRLHHRFSDTERDIHSPQKGFWWSHVGWILCDKFKDTDYDLIKDFTKYPELVWLNKHDWVGPWMLGFASYLIAGWPGLLVGFFGSTVLLWHATFTVNSLNHVFGKRRYVTTDTSRNSAILALWTMGEGWHNNHHYYAAAARNGFFWWEYDLSYTILKGLSYFRIVTRLRVPPERVLAAARVRDGQLDIGMFRAYWGKATAALHEATSRLQQRMSDAAGAAAEKVNGRLHGDPAVQTAELAPSTRAVATGDAPVPGTSLDDASSAAHIELIAHQVELADKQAKLAQLEEVMRTTRAAFEACLADTLRTAEEYSDAARQREREIVAQHSASA
ncbi:MAG TPA: acyl-CoA desaturase [Acidimicrobiales bacterium]|nr:acyl-CoA desaturase [Acidimicrobiales bacterium]